LFEGKAPLYHAPIRKSPLGLRGDKFTGARDPALPSLAWPSQDGRESRAGAKKLQNQNQTKEKDKVGSRKD
jgi:hypothetical protein